MLRISDILKKYKEDRRRREEQAQQAQEQMGMHAAFEGGPSSSELPSNARVSIFSAVTKELNTINGSKAQEVYSQALELSKRTYCKDAILDSALFASVAVVVEKTADLLSAGNKSLLKICLGDYPDLKDYLSFHCVNVCIIAIEVGLGFGYERERLIEIAIAGFLHDIGEVKYLDSVYKNGVLETEEFSKVKQHPMTGIDILNPFAKELSHTVFDVIRQEHERIDGSGYPHGIKNHQISEYARIIGLVDVYEAIMHQRPYRAKFTALETVKTILKDKARFDAQVIKILIERIGIFPVGTLVKLNTKETGVVIRENADLPLRPTVNILFDSYGKELKEPKEINLADNSMIYVEECLKGC